MTNHFYQGEKFGDWEIIEKDTTRSVGKGNFWICKCVCGVIRSISSTYLKSGKSTSCGCAKYRKLSDKLKGDLIGQKFNRLTVIGDTGKRKQGAVVWLCLCDCGNYTESVSGNLRRTHKSCGCLNSETVIKRNKDNAKHGKYNTTEYRKAINQRRRELKIKLDSCWTYEMETALSELQLHCVVCGGTDRLATDHVLPLIKGNGLVPGNAVKLCVHCNSVKKERDLIVLPLYWQQLIKDAAQSFKYYWEEI